MMGGGGAGATALPVNAMSVVYSIGRIRENCFFLVCFFSFFFFRGGGGKQNHPYMMRVVFVVFSVWCVVVLSLITSTLANYEYK